MKHHVTVEEISSPRKTQAIVKARHDVWAWLHDDLGFSWPEVATLFGKKYNGKYVPKERKDKIQRELEDEVAGKIASWIGAFVKKTERAIDGAALLAAVRRGDWRT